MTKERGAEIRVLCRDGGTAQWWVVANELLKEIDRLRATLVQVESHLAAIAESPCAMGGPDIEQLGLARDAIDEALEQK